MPPTNEIGHRFIELLTVDSTNNYAMGLVHAGMAQHGTAVFSHEQTKGKGQRDKRWVSTANENIILSIIIEPVLPVNRQFLLSMCIAVAVQQFFSRMAAEETKIKWPNDLYWRDRKAGGILIENVINGFDWRYAIVGIGININQTSFSNVAKAVSLKQITGKSFDATGLAKELLQNVEQSFQRLTTFSDGIISEYHQHLYKRNEQVRLKKGSRIFNAIIKGVDENGFLLTQSGVEEKFGVGEVEWLL